MYIHYKNARNWHKIDVSNDDACDLRFYLRRLELFISTIDINLILYKYLQNDKIISCKIIPYVSQTPYYVQQFPHNFSFFVDPFKIASIGIFTFLSSRVTWSGSTCRATCDIWERRERGPQLRFVSHGVRISRSVSVSLSLSLAARVSPPLLVIRPKNAISRKITTARQSVRCIQ